MKKIAFSILFCAAAFVATAQEKSQADVQRIVESGNYVFVAQRVYPQSGSSRTLTSDYNVTVAGKKIVSYLPYFGRAHYIPLSSEGGIKFTSTDFKYVKAKNGDAWAILIKPSDVPDVQQMNFEIFDNGKATLNVVNTSRESIAYHGYIVEVGSTKRGF